MPRFRRYLIATIVIHTAVWASAQEAKKEPPCSAPENRQFDFWIGEWTVTAGGKEVGANRITSILGGCTLLEEYTAGSGYEGKSINYYDAQSHVWRQVWVDNTGLQLSLSGRFEDGKMVLSGASRRGGKMLIDRITWTPNEDETVRQVWEVSEDTGATWKTVFDGLYTPK